MVFGFCRHPADQLEAVPNGTSIGKSVTTKSRSWSIAHISEEGEIVPTTLRRLHRKVLTTMGLTFALRFPWMQGFLCPKQVEVQRETGYRGHLSSET